MGKTDEDKTYVTTKFVADQCGVSKSTVMKWIREDKLKAIRLPGRHFRIHKGDFQKFFNSLQYHSPAAQDGAGTNV